MTGKSFALLEAIHLQVKTASVCGRLNKKRLFELPASALKIPYPLSWEDGAVWQGLLGELPISAHLANQSPWQLPLQCEKGHDPVFMSLL